MHFTRPSITPTVSGLPINDHVSVTDILHAAALDQLVKAMAYSLVKTGI